jgi:hypothetical protein
MQQSFNRTDILQEDKPRNHSDNEYRSQPVTLCFDAMISTSRA